MRAVLSRVPGGPETLVIEDLPDPVPGPGEVVIAVEAAALNFMDTLIIADRYQVKPPRPFSPSAECCGRVVALGDGANRFTVGDRVVAMPGFGAARERLCVAETLCAPVPETMDAALAAGVLVTYGTAVFGLADRARLLAGETLLVTGATGGAGSAALAVGRLLGARVIAAVGSPDKRSAAVSLGADEVVVLEAATARQTLRDLGRIDVIYDTVGADLAEPLVRALPFGGRFVVVGFAGGTIPALPLNLVLLKSVDIVGVNLAAHLSHDPQAVPRLAALLFPALAEGRLTPPPTTRRPLDEASAAIAALADRSVIGKLVLVP